MNNQNKHVVRISMIMNNNQKPSEQIHGTFLFFIIFQGSKTTTMGASALDHPSVRCEFEGLAVLRHGRQDDQLILQGWALQQTGEMGGRVDINNSKQQRNTKNIKEQEPTTSKNKNKNKNNKEEEQTIS